MYLVKVTQWLHALIPSLVCPVDSLQRRELIYPSMKCIFIVHWVEKYTRTLQMKNKENKVFGKIIVKRVI